MKNTTITVAAALFVIQAASQANDFCTGPQNADAYKSTRTPIQNGACHYYQEYQTSSGNSNYASGSCGGFSVSFGKLGGFERGGDAVNLYANWSDPPPTNSAACAKAYSAAIAWGYRCDNAGCTAGEWEQIGAPQVRVGSWNSVSNICYLEVGFGASNKDYLTVNIDAQAYTKNGQNLQYRPVRTRIHNRIQGNGKCIDASPPKRRIQRPALPEKRYKRIN